MSDPLRRIFIEAFDGIFKRERGEIDDVRKEVASKGTYWASREIWDLRRQVAALRERLAKEEGKS